jgi:hypothetical protein
MGEHGCVELDDDSEHEVVIVEKAWGAARWKCSCGASSGGRWSRSAEQALKAAGRHRDRHVHDA